MILEKSQAPAVSVVIPFFDEEACARRLLCELRDVMDGLPYRYEVVVVDDGSFDKTASVLEDCGRRDPHLRIFGWKRNRGQAAALLHGMDAARGSIIVTLDGDGQNDPADIPALLARLTGADMVVGIRASRRDTRLRRWLSRLFNGVRGRFLGDHIQDSGCALKAFRREVVASFLPIHTLYSFMPAFALAAGFRVEQQPVAHRPRQGGRTSYGLRRFLWYPAVDTLAVRWFQFRRIPAWFDSGDTGLVIDPHSLQQSLQPKHPSAPERPRVPFG